ncbi:DUF808 domain-containing protein [Corynebacterium aquatimens]|uniref:DNA repair protein MutK n=1 Tax=Corynebacterium aquatimens TaxID=1190508 RepID=A0A931DTQ4_9CORY|nr:DUF808 domain-containing protein [Corynebacterium aquatimens]MBG6121269.1 putative DNA repair protein MutK [Corynebacterium aquatimens]WJY66181.1 Inner membrane protein YedI [Corynebacterium aquatimens]
MAGGLLAVLDDVALIARTASSSMDDVAAMAAKTSTKAAGVVIDDAAVTPQYVSNVTPARELPMIWKITKGSLRNKLIFILPVALLLNAVAPFLLVPILMVGGAYLCFEGAEKIAHKLFHSGEDDHDPTEKTPEDEDTLVKQAITTDLILSAEIMIIALDEVADQPLWMEFFVLLVVGIGITFGVYGAVGLLVKIDDIGLHMIEEDRGAGFGRVLVKGMPYVLQAIGIIGTIAMLWVGGHLIIRGLHEVLGFSWPHDVAEHLVHAAGGGALGWMAETAVSLIAGLITGFLVLFITKGVKRLVSARS